MIHWGGCLEAKGCYSQLHICTEKIGYFLNSTQIQKLLDIGPRLNNFRDINKENKSFNPWKLTFTELTAFLVYFSGFLFLIRRLIFFVFRIILPWQYCDAWPESMKQGPKISLSLQTFWTVLGHLYKILAFFLSFFPNIKIHPCHLVKVLHDFTCGSHMRSYVGRSSLFSLHGPFLHCQIQMTL